MKKICLLILWLISLSFAWNLTRANSEYEYTNLDITANILSDGTINVKEDFTANFFVSKHWIIRDIPLNYSVWWKKFHIEVSNIDVQWKKFTTSTNDGNIKIKIWDADRTVIWEQNYPISYSTYGLIRNFSWMWYAELYWNLVGYDFDTNINKVRAELILPKIYTWFTADDFLITTDWTAKTIDKFAWTVDWSQWDRIIITYNKWLSAYHGITLAIKFPNNYFTFDHNRQAGLVGHKNSQQTYHLNTYNTSSNDGWMPVFLFISIVLILTILWNLPTKKSHKINLNEWKLAWKFAEQFPVIVQYEPPKWLNSAEVWLLLHRNNQYSRAKDLFSLIYKWAAEWLITIEPRTNPKKGKIWNINIGQQVKKFFNLKSNNYEKKVEYDWILVTKKNNIPSLYPEYEKNLFYWFATNSIIFKNNYLFWYSLYKEFDDDWNYLYTPKRLYEDLSNYASDLENYCIEKWWKKHRSLFSVFTKPETEQWAKIISHILWYREFLAKCDENKLRLFLQQDPFYFDKILPYAIVFWLETELVKKIMPIMKEMDISSNIYSWDLLVLSETFSDISSSLHSYSTSSSYSSGSWWDSWSSFDSGWSDFSSGWGGWWWGWSSW